MYSERAEWTRLKPDVHSPTPPSAIAPSMQNLPNATMWTHLSLKKCFASISDYKYSILATFLYSLFQIPFFLKFSLKTQNIPGDETSVLMLPSRMDVSHLVRLYIYFDQQIHSS